MKDPDDTSNPSVNDTRSQTSEMINPVVGTVDVDCPSCRNLNRAARRKCRVCGHTGRVKKNVPIGFRR